MKGVGFLQLGEAKEDGEMSEKGSYLPAAATKYWQKTFQVLRLLLGTGGFPVAASTQH